MTRIDTHPSHPPHDRPVTKAVTNESDGQDFLEHLRAGTHATRTDEQQARNTRPPAAGNDGFPRADGDHEASLIQPPVARPIRPNASMEINAASRSSVLSTSAILQTDHPAQAALGEVVDRVRVFEQHWFGNGYLSFIDGTGEAHLPKVANGAIGAPLGSIDIAHFQNVATSPATPSLPGQPPEGTAWPVMVEAPGCGSDILPRSIERMARALGPLVAADQPWPERLLRVSQRADGKAAFWVRDYGLSAEAIDPLVQHLRQLAMRNGVTLERVVVNGTVIWHSESFEGES